MINKISAILVFFVFTLAVVSCTDAPEGTKVKANDATTETPPAPAAAESYKVDTEASVINWTGTKPTGQHNGTVKIADGTLMIAGDQLTGGKFTIDFNSIANTDMNPGEGKEKLEGHLKTGDFFETDKYPTGTFVITKVEKVANNADATHNITGNLTMKDVTKSVTLPAKVAVMGDKVSAKTPAFTIDRTEWGITYKSTMINTAKDKMINDEIGLEIMLMANK